MDLEALKRALSVARGDHPADTVFKNARIVNVLSAEIHEGDVAVYDGQIVGIGEYTGREERDLAGSYLAPAFIDGHIHIESTMLTVHEFAKTVVPHGTAGAIIDPHEFANVLGMRGIRYVIQAAKEVPLDLYVMASSCVPATPLETAGAAITVEDIKALLDTGGVIGLAELMNFPGVFLGWDSELQKIALSAGKPIDGHSPGLRGPNLNAYIHAGVRSDHECTTIDEARDKLRRGMHILLREGTAERNLHDLLPLVTAQNARNFSFATDDKHPADLIDEGHIDHHIRESVAFGIDPLLAIQMATINTARHYGLSGRGAIAPGYRADLVVFNDLQDIRPREVFHSGRLVAKDGVMTNDIPSTVDMQEMRNTMNAAPFTETDLQVRAAGESRIKVIEIVPRQIVTKAIIEEPKVEDGFVVPDTQRDILKLAVIERHKATGNIGLGFVKGFGLTRGALGSTVAHDAHNIIIIGTNDGDMVRVAEELVLMGGGQCIVENGILIESLPLPIAGLVSDRPVENVRKSNDALADAAASRGCVLPDPFMTLSFLALSPIPELKVTDLGLVDALNFELTNLFVDAHSDT